MGYDDAIDSAGRMALFGEKYGDDRARAHASAPTSAPSCAAARTWAATGDIGLFKIISEGGVAAGVRRIEAVTGAGALAWVRERLELLQRAAGALKVGAEELPERVEALLGRSRELEKAAEKAAAGDAMATVKRWAAQPQTIGDTPVIIERAPVGEAKVLREMVDALKNQLPGCAVLLAGEREGKVALIAGVSKPLTDRLKAGEWVNQAAQQVGGRGGGRPDMAQAGGSEPGQIDAALEAARAHAAAALGG